MISQPLWISGARLGQKARRGPERLAQAEQAETQLLVQPALLLLVLDDLVRDSPQGMLDESSCLTIYSSAIQLRESKERVSVLEGGWGEG